MRVVVLTTSWPRTEQEFAGRFVADAVERLRERGVEVEVLAPGEGMSFIAPSWDSTGVYVFDKNGQMRPGFPFKTTDPIWGSATITDLDKDGHMEIAFACGVLDSIVLP